MNRGLWLMSLVVYAVGSFAPTGLPWQNCQPAAAQPSSQAPLIVKLEPLTAAAAPVTASQLASAKQLLAMRLDALGLPYQVQLNPAVPQLEVQLAGRLTAAQIVALLKPVSLDFLLGELGEDSWLPTGLTGQDIASVTAFKVQDTDDWAVEMTFTPAGQQMLFDVTQSAIGQTFGMFLDEMLILAPSIQQAIPGGKIRIDGGFTQEAATTLAQQINAAVQPLKWTLQGY